ncbi:hypothetical protein FDA94_05320 [Herbidospora galbida]|uniref:Uncharacterized protein n=1 Tax=Herbidospora galbida TaxID=2575442 RepID=A0A4V5V1N1_9ACTN|nr:hypothetical protein [Herbidospora galbida]TKK90423.1 hypothetical protein FDA94_05320 [Herbidospora galbida]
MAYSEPFFGDRVVSWTNIWTDLYPEDPYNPHDDHAAFTMQRLRGTVLAQAAELEDVMSAIIEHLDPQARSKRRTAGQALHAINSALTPADKDFWIYELEVIDRAIKSRNRIAHNRITIGSAWTDYATGGGEWTPVVSMIGNDLYDEGDLLVDLNLQQLATRDAVRLLHFLVHRDSLDAEDS